MKSNLLRALLLGATLASGLSLAAAPAITGHSGLKGQTLNADDAKAVLLGKKIMIGDARVVIIIAKAGAAQDQALQQFAGMSTSQFQNHWRRLFMTGGGTAPKIVETEADAVKLAGETPGGVTFVDSAQAGDLAILTK